MNIARTYERLLAFIQRNERSLASILFVSGFVSDLLTFGLLSLRAVTLLFAAYLAIVTVLTIVAHVTYKKQGNPVVRSVAVLAPLFAQFTFGSLLSGFVIFYTKSAVLSISWPFIFLLIAIFFGNELFRNYREHLIFQTLLLYFSFYAFFVFALPVYQGEIGTMVFLQSTALTVFVFALYLTILWKLGAQRLRNALLPIVVSTTVITALVVGSYSAGLLPPIPLALKSGGIYHSIEHVQGGYEVTGEDMRAWYDPRPQLVHHVPGTPLYAFSSIFAPGAFSTSVMHVWQRYDEEDKKWITESTVAFSLTGGREGGYRGYSLKYDPQPGEWRVLVQTGSGQTMGNLRFSVVNVAKKPALRTQTF